VIYVAGWELFVRLSGWDFMTDYARAILEGMRADGAPRPAIDAKAAELAGLAARYRDPLFRLPMTFIEIFPVGPGMALISAALLRNPRLFPVRRTPSGD